jgi:hypothetical protein
MRTALLLLGLAAPVSAFAGPFSGFYVDGSMGTDSVDVTGLSDVTWAEAIGDDGIVGPGVESELIPPYVLGDFSDVDRTLRVDVNTSFSVMTFNGLRFTLTDPGSPSLAHAYLIGTNITGFGANRLTSAGNRVALNFQGMSAVGYVLIGWEDPGVAVRGACPGSADILLRGFTPRSQVVLASGSSAGRTVLPGGPCRGTALGISQAATVGTFRTNADGDLRLSPNLPAGVCGRYVQAVDVTSCVVSAPTRLP